MANNEERKRLWRAIAEARQNPGVLHLRDMIKREHDEAQKRPRNEALEKWGAIIEEQMQRDMQRQERDSRHQSKPAAPTPPQRDGPDLDRD
jgi:hypothetical protein